MELRERERLRRMQEEEEHQKQQQREYEQRQLDRKNINTQLQCHSAAWGFKEKLIDNSDKSNTYFLFKNYFLSLFSCLFFLHSLFLVFLPPEILQMAYEKNLEFPLTFQIASNKLDMTSSGEPKVTHGRALGKPNNVVYD